MIEDRSTEIATLVCAASLVVIILAISGGLIAAIWGLDPRVLLAVALANILVLTVSSIWASH